MYAKNGAIRSGTDIEATLLNELALQAVEEIFRHDIVVEGSLVRHTLTDIVVRGVSDRPL